MEKITERRCIASGKVKPLSALLRFVKTEDSRLVPDFGKKIPGRGLYVTNSRKMLKTALDKNLFVKSIHQHLKIDENFLETVENLLHNKGLETINLARKAGAAVAGFEKVKDNILKNKVAFVIEAADAGQDGSTKMEVLSKDIEILKVYTSDELDNALDKVNTVYIAILKSGIATMVYANLKRYQSFCD